MKAFGLAIAAALLFSTPVSAAIPLVPDLAGQISHSGGCRKDSPPGKCCHAGSKPYHCH